MKKALLGILMLVGVSSFAAPASAPASAPQAALHRGGFYACPNGWSLVQTQQYVTYSAVVGYTMQCGPFGHFCRQMPVYQNYTTLVPANYCVPGTIVY